MYVTPAGEALMWMKVLNGAHSLLIDSSSMKNVELIVIKCGPVL